MVGTYKKLEELESKLAVLEVDMGVLQKYGAQSKYEDCSRDILELEKQVKFLENKKFFCEECGNILKKEERIYTLASGGGGDVFLLWDTYICENCGFFIWDEDSERHLGGWNSVKNDDPRHRGTSDGHPKFDSDNKR